MTTRRPGRWLPGLVVLAALASGYSAHAATASLAPSWITESNQPGAVYGRSVASAGDVNGDGYADVIVGSHMYQNPGGQGRVFVYYGSPAGLPTTPTWSVQGQLANQGFGYSVAGAGDVNDDGYDDVIIGRAFDHATGGGQAWVYHGSPAGLGASADWTVAGEGGFGGFVASAGDVNGDGYTDVIIGRAGTPFSPYGGIWIYHGSANGLPQTAAFSIPPNASTNYAIRSFAGAGDVNGDGYDDVIMGRYGYGAAIIHLGSPSGLSPTPGWSSAVNEHGTNAGTSVAGAGDVNLDGFDDFLVGASLYANGQESEGRAFLFLGSAGVPDTYPEWTAEGNQAGALFGSVVAGAGDVNGDSYADLLIGAPAYDGGQLDEGRVFVYFGSALGPSLTPDWTAESDQAGSGFAASAASAGDVNGDGGADIVVGADQFHNPEDFEGRAYVYQTALVGVPGPGPAIPALSLAPPSPNPSPRGFELRYALPAEGRVRLTVHDVTGRSVAVLSDGAETAGPHVVHWDGGGHGAARMPSGVYVARLEFAGRIEQRKMVLTR